MAGGLAKKGLIRLIKVLPGVEKYIEEKHHMHLELEKQKQLIDDLTVRNEKLTEELQNIRRAMEEAAAKKVPVLWPRFEKDVLAADLRTPSTAKLKRKPPFSINWVLPAMEKASGGRADILRTVAYLETKGHKCRLYFYDPSNSQNLSEIQRDLEDYHPKVKAKLYYNADTMLDSDVIFATNYYSAYPVYNHQKEAHKCYYIQDFEPYFELPGSHHVLATNTYRFGLRGITIGSWLSSKLEKEFGMRCDHFDFGVDPNRYYLTNKKNRQGILFYARPSTPRRGFELGILALKIFHDNYPDQPIHIAGADVSKYKIPFPYINHGVISLDQLNPLYNSCYGGLVISLTNLSLLPLEMLAAGCIPVVNEAPNTTMVPFADYIKYCKDSPRSMAAVLGEVIDNYSGLEAEEASKAAHRYSWDKSNAQIEKILIKDLS